VSRTTQELEIDFVVIDHESDDPSTRQYLETLEREGRARILPYKGVFNYSAINNAAIAKYGAGYDFFLFLNNDIEAVSAGWLEPMVDLAMRSDVGAVGATLLYPDGSIQHSGVVIGIHGLAEHAHRTKELRSDDAGYNGSLHATREYSAVTAACMLIPAPVFREVDGFDEALKVGFNDTDLCLRIRKRGYRVVNCADAVLVHHESATRGKSYDGFDSHPEDTALFKSRYKDIITDGDPYFSPLLSRHNPTFILDTGAHLRPHVEYRSVRNILPSRRPCKSQHDFVLCQKS
jgi:GT2 family glycosyltransferase